jgi:hypothetical protein
MLACLPAASGADTQPLLVDNFDQDPTGDIPTGWSLAKTIAGTSALVAEGTPSGNKWVILHDDNGPGITTNNTLYRGFTPVSASTGSGRVAAQFDVNLAQITAGFGTRLYNGGVPTTGSNWATAVLFEGNTAYATGASPGTISYQTSVSTYLLTPLARTYSAGAWYTVRVEANLNTKLYRIFLAPQDGSLTQITPAGGVPFITSSTGTQVSEIGGISFYTSNRDNDTAGDLLIDNVNVYLDEPELPIQANTIAEARLLLRGTKISLVDKIVTAGTAGGIFYIEDDTPGAYRAAGIRVRCADQVVREGDRVDVIGRIGQSSEGNPSDHAGEREINAPQVTIRSSGNPVPRPVYIRNKHVSGSWLGPMELLTEGYEPAIKGVWPYNSWGNTGVSTWIDPQQVDAADPLNNTGLLVTVSGKVLEPTVYDPPGANYDFYIDDGSLLNDGWFSAENYGDEVFHPRGLRIRVTDPDSLSQAAPLYHGDVVRATGIAGAIACNDLGRPSSRNVRIVRPRKPEDVRVLHRDPKYVRFDRYGNALVDGRPFFPIGIYLYSWDSNVMSQVLQQGFNTVIWGATPADLDTLRDNDLMMLPYSKPEWLAVKDHPSILAWYLTDEPEGQGYTPRSMREEYERVRAEDPSRPIGLCHFLWDALTNYKHSADFVMSDVYPINPTHDAPLDPIWHHMDQIHVIHGWNFPVWPVIQTFGGPDSDGGKWGIPTPQESRAMTYIALAHRAKAMLYFSYQPGLTELWAAVRTLCGELRQLTPFLVFPSSELAISSSDGSVHARCIQVGNSGLVITVNVTRNPVQATLTIPSVPVSELALPFEGGTISLTAGAFTASFDALGVHVYQWGPTPGG